MFQWPVRDLDSNQTGRNSLRDKKGTARADEKDVAFLHIVHMFSMNSVSFGEWLDIVGVVPDKAASHV